MQRPWGRKQLAEIQRERRVQGAAWEGRGWGGTLQTLRGAGAGSWGFIPRALGAPTASEAGPGRSAHLGCVSESASADLRWLCLLSPGDGSLPFLRLITPPASFNNWQERFSGCLILLKDSNLMINSGMVASSLRHKTRSAVDTSLPPTLLATRDPPPPCHSDAV